MAPHRRGLKLKNGNPKLSVGQLNSLHSPINEINNLNSKQSAKVTELKVLLQPYTVSKVSDFHYQKKIYKDRSK